MTSRTRNLTILGVVAVLLVLALLVIVPGSPLSKDTKLGLDLEGGIELVYEGRADAAGARGHAAVDRRRDRDDAQARRLARRLRAGDPARGRATRSPSGCPTCRTPSARASRSATRPGSSSTTGSRTSSPTARPTPAATRSSTRSRRPRRRRARPRQTDVPPGSDLTPARGRQGQQHRQGPLLPVRPRPAPDRPRQEAGPRRAATSRRGPARTCSSDYEAKAPARRPSTPRAPSAVSELEALGSGGPPAGSRVIKVPEGVVVLEQEPAPNQPPQIQRYTVLEDDSELSGEDIKNPKAGTDPNTNAPLVTMEFTDKGREAFARVTKRIAERGFEAVDAVARRDRQGAVLPALRDHARQPDRLAGDDRLRLQPGGDRRPHRRPDRERRRLRRRQRPRREPAHRRPADRAQADLGDPGVGHARPAGAPPGPDRRRRRPGADDPVPARSSTACSAWWPRRRC